MAEVVVTIEIMPESPDVDLESIKVAALDYISDFAGDDHEARMEEIPIAFGLKQIKIIFLLNESKGNLDPLENQINSIKGVNEAKVADVRRAFG